MKEGKQKTTILIIYGPNFNLIGQSHNSKKHRITIDKLNKVIKTKVKGLIYKTKFFQTNSESKAVGFIQKNKDKAAALLLFPGAWQQSGYSIVDILNILEIPFVTVSKGEPVQNIVGFDNFINENMLISCGDAIMKLSLFLNNLNKE